MSNRYLIWGLAFSVGLNLVMLGMVGHHLAGAPWTPARASAPPSSPGTHALQFDEKRLKLTPEQRERFQEIRDHWNKGEQKAKKEGENRIKRLSALLVRDDVTTESLRPLFHEFSSHSDEFFVRLSAALQEYRAELAPEQRVVFNTILKERFALLQKFVNRKNTEFEQRVTATMQRKKADRRDQKAGDKKGNRPEKQNGKPAGQKPEKQAGKPAGQRPEIKHKDEKPAMAN